MPPMLQDPRADAVGRAVQAAAMLRQLQQAQMMQGGGDPGMQAMPAPPDQGAPQPGWENGLPSADPAAGAAPMGDVAPQGQQMAPPEAELGGGDEAYAHAGWGTAEPFDYDAEAAANVNPGAMPQPGPPPGDSSPGDAQLKHFIAGAHKDPKRAAALAELGAFLQQMGKMHAARHKLHGAIRDQSNPNA